MKNFNVQNSRALAKARREIRSADLLGKMALRQNYTVPVKKASQGWLCRLDFLSAPPARVLYRYMYYVGVDLMY